tara:strand:+ start:193 stop:702 length:510 start_codon:yes stop_codon:yes gene_type:complete
MPHATTTKNFRDGTLLIEDGTGTPNAFTVIYEAGDFSISGLVQGQKESTVYLDRGDLGSIRHTNQTFPSGSFSMHMVDLSDGSYATAIDLMLQTGKFVAGGGTPGVSTLGANSEVYTVKLTLTIEGSDHGDDSDHTIVLDDALCSIDASEGDPNSISVSFTCYGSITLT